MIGNAEGTHVFVREVICGLVKRCHLRVMLLGVPFSLKIKVLQVYNTTTPITESAPEFPDKVKARAHLPPVCRLLYRSRPVSSESRAF